MNINEVLNILVQAIATDGDIIEWAQINFNTKHIVYLAVDPDHPPVSTEAPFVEIALGKRQRNRDTRCIEYEVLVGCFVKNEEETKDDNIVIRTGQRQINEFAELVEKRVVETFNDNSILWQSEETLPDSLMSHTFRAIWNFKVSCRSLIE
jgi:hypothetical protein